MNTRKTAERIVYECTGEPKISPDAPYQTQLIEQIDAALVKAQDESRQQVGRALVEVAGQPDLDHHVSIVLRDLGEKLAKTTTEKLVNDGLSALADEILAGT